MDNSTATLCHSDFVWNVECCAPAQSTFAQPQTMTAFTLPSDRIEARQTAQPVTLSKLLLIALVIGLGAAAAYLVSESRFLVSPSSMSYVLSADSTRIKPLRRTAAMNTHHQFAERTQIPYFGASGNLHINRDLEYEY